jgi:hypothetical protein
MVYGKDTDLEKQHLLLSAQHVKIYPSGHHFSPKLPPALEGKVLSRTTPPIFSLLVYHNYYDYLQFF